MAAIELGEIGDVSTGALPLDFGLALVVVVLGLPVRLR
jgi:hypothetical protein